MKLLFRPALVIALLVAIGQYTRRALNPNQPGSWEGATLAVVQRLRNERVSADWLYQPPYTLNCYGPGYYWATLGVAALTRQEHSPVPGRLVSLAAFLLTTAAVAGAVWLRTHHVEVALLTALLALVSPIAQEWIPWHRVDALAVLFSIGAYLAADRATRGALAASAVLIVLGSLVKQTVALAALPIVLYLLLQRRFRAALAYATGVALLGALAWLWVDWCNDGYFLTTAIMGNLNTFYPGRALEFGIPFLTSWPAVLTLASLAALVVDKPRQCRDSLFPLAFLTSTALATVMTGKEGADGNYYLDAGFLGTIVIGQYGLSRLFAVHATRGVALAWLLAGFWVLLGLQGIRKDLWQSPASPAARVIEDLVQERPGAEFLVDGNHCLNLFLATGKLPLVNDSCLYKVFVEKGMVDAGPVVQMMRHGTIAALILSRTMENHQRASAVDRAWPLPVLAAMERHYVLHSESGGVYIYKHQQSNE